MTLKIILSKYSILTMSSSLHKINQSEVIASNNLHILPSIPIFAGFLMYLSLSGWDFEILDILKYDSFWSWESLSTIRISTPTGSLFKIASTPDSALWPRLKVGIPIVILFFIIIKKLWGEDYCWLNQTQANTTTQWWECCFIDQSLQSRLLPCGAVLRSGML